MSNFVTVPHVPSPARPRRTLVFDLDGTLIDSVPDLLASGNRLMAALGLPPFTAADIVPMIGDGAGVLLRRMMSARGAEATPDHLRTFIQDYTAHVADHTRAYPGVPETLAALAQAGWRLAVCTNKPEAPARDVLARLGLLPWFAAIGAGDTYPSRKPDPAHLLATLRDAGGAPSHAIMVGDHHNDLAAAAGASLPSVFAEWGYGQNTGASASLSTVTDLPALAERLLPLSEEPPSESPKA